MPREEVVLEPIGHVRSPEKEGRRGTFRDVEAEIVVREDLVEGLDGLDGFSHVEVIYYMHLPSDKRGRGLRVHPMGFEDLPEVGLFATRSPHRPNRIGLTLCELLSVEGNVLRVKGLDALDGSPVLDIKGPTRRYLDVLPELRFPGWTEAMREKVAEMERKGELR